LSGILAILIAGLAMRNYAYFSLSPYGQITIDHLVEGAGYICENFVFAYLGVSIPMSINLINPRMIWVGCVALLGSRFISVAVISLFVNCFKKEKVPLSHQIVMTYGGLRGAVAYYLALNLHTPYKDVLQTMTVVLISFTVIGLGSTTNCLLKILNVCCKKDKIIQDEKDVEEEIIPLVGDDDAQSEGARSEGVITRLADYDVNVFRKYLRKEEMKVKDVEKVSEASFRKSHE
jgi:NhaP-type Na+/H+ or K+/H+ antiporter